MDTNIGEKYLPTKMRGFSGEALYRPEKCKLKGVFVRRRNAIGYVGQKFSVGQLFAVSTVREGVELYLSAMSPDGEKLTGSGGEWAADVAGDYVVTLLARNNGEEQTVQAVYHCFDPSRQYDRLDVSDYRAFYGKVDGAAKRFVLLKGERTRIYALKSAGVVGNEYDLKDFFKIKRFPSKNAGLFITATDSKGEPVKFYGTKFVPKRAGTYCVTLNVAHRRYNGCYRADFHVVERDEQYIPEEDLNQLPRRGIVGRHTEIPAVTVFENGVYSADTAVSVVSPSGCVVETAQSKGGVSVPLVESGDYMMMYRINENYASRKLKVYAGRREYARANRKQLLEKIKKTDIVSNWQYYIMLLPAILVFFVFTYMSLPGIFLAFQRYTVTGGLFGNEWIGFENFKTFFTGPYFWVTTRNTFIINISNLIVGTTASIVFALLLNELMANKSKKLYQNILFIPTFFSVLLVSRFLSLIFSNDRGILNNLLESIGMTRVAFYDSPQYWVPIVVFTYIWKGVGYNLIVYLATIMGIDRSIYEAAYIDGAGRMKQISTITLPLLLPTILILTLMNVGRIFYGDFQMIYAIVGTSNTSLMETLDIIETYLFRMVTGATPDYGLAGAVGLYQTVLGFIMIFGSNTFVKLYDKDYALF